MQTDYRLHFLLALWSLLCGGFLGSVNDVFRAFRGNGKLRIFVSDLLFSGVCTVTMLLLFFNLSYGRMRAYAFVISLAGFVLWKKTAGRLFFAFLVRVRRMIGIATSKFKSAVVKWCGLACSFAHTKRYCGHTLSFVRYGLKPNNKKEVYNGNQKSQE